MASTYELIVSDDVWRDASGGLSLALEGAPDGMPMGLEDAQWAPECRGLYGAPAFTVPMLRGAIARGELQSERRGRLIMVTRAGLRAWRGGDGWQGEREPRGASARSPGRSVSQAEDSRTSGIAPAASRLTASSAVVSGSSCTAVPKSLALIAALAKARNAKRSGS